MPGIGDLFGKDSIGQQFLLWNVGSELAAALLAPLLQNIENQTWSLDPAMPLSPQILAELAVRGITTEAHGADEAAKTGTNGDNFGLLLKAATHAPDLSLLLEGLRRGILTEGGTAEGTASVEEGLQDAGIRPVYWDLIKALRIQIPTIAEVMNAWLEGQITEEEAQHRYNLAGGDPTWFQTSYNANGQAPTPDMLGVMLNRKIIPEGGQGPGVVSYTQGFLEGPWRNKWLPAMLELRQYLPPPRTVTALQHEGVITNDEALALYEKEGLTPELAASYVKSATQAKVATSHALAKSEVLTLYKDRLITAPVAMDMLATLRYSSTDAAYEIAMADFSREVKLLNATVSKIHSYYVAHKLTKQAATADLMALDVPATQVEDIFRHWDIELSVNVKPLTEAQIANGWANNALTYDEAVTEMGRIGVTEFDAWVLLSIANKGPLPNKPPAPIPAGALNP